MTDQDTMPAVDLSVPEQAETAMLEWIEQWASASSPVAKYGVLSSYLAGKVTAALSATPEARPPIETAELLTAMADASGYGEGRSATPLSQAPAGQGVGVEERDAIARIIEDEIDLVECGEGEWRIGGFEHAADAIRLRLAAQPTQDDAKRLRELLYGLEVAYVNWLADDSRDDDTRLINRVEDTVEAYRALTPTSKTGDTYHAPEQ